VRRLLPPEVLAELTRLDPWRASYAIAQSAAIAAAAIALAWTHFEWWVVISAVLLIGTQQARSVRAGARSGALSVVRDQNGSTIFLGACSEHSAPFRSAATASSTGCITTTCTARSIPTSRCTVDIRGGKSYLLRKLLLDLSGFNAWKNIAYFFGNPAINAATRRAQRPLDDTSPSLRAAARRDRLVVAAFHIAVRSPSF